MTKVRSESEELQPSATADARPIAPSERILAIDMVRGIALFGVMAINVTTEFRVSIFEQFLRGGIDGGELDRALHSLLMIAINLKAFALFSLLFGVGLAIQHDHLSRHPQRITLLVRRLTFLMLVGAVHLLLVWNGDILFEYAIAGFVVMPILFGPSRLPATIGLALLGVFIASPFLPPIATMPSSYWMTHTVAEATRVYGFSGFTDVLAFRIRELPGILPLHLFIFPRTVALMLVGAAVWRAGLLRTGSWASTHLPMVAAIGVGCGALLAEIQAINLLHFGWQGQLSLERLSSVLLALGYGALIVWASERTRARSLLAWAAPLGRMAFTNYVMQSVVFGWLFYGYGLGLFAKVGVATALAIGTSVYAAQAVISALWLRRYCFGPLEWLWRSATYGTWQPVRR